MLKATISPTNATNQNLIWSSSDYSIVDILASDEYGSLLIETMSTGTAIITAQAPDGSGVTATCKVTVN